MADTYTTIALITGANQGIGLEIARKLAAENTTYHILLAGRRKDAVEEAVAKLHAEGLLSVEPLIMDITSDSSIADAAAFVDQKFGRLDVLVNNVGISRPAPSKTPLGTRGKFHAIFDTNLFGSAVVTDAFITLLEKSSTIRRVIFMTSELGSLSHKINPEYMARKQEFVEYSSSKAGLNMLALHYAVRYEDDETWKFNVCCPGYCATNLNGYAGSNGPVTGALNACRLATAGRDGETGTFSNSSGLIAW
jgi:NAD(P)-dependent dehydrogenase (short-subunit alcohol dehydrogenase family)